MRDLTRTPFRMVFSLILMDLVVGLGGTRASSFFPNLLSTTGLPGTLLFAGAILTVIRRAVSVYEYRPVIWALVTLLMVKVVSGPDLSDASGVLWISIGLLAHAAQTQAETPRVDRSS